MQLHNATAKCNWAHRLGFTHYINGLASFHLSEKLPMLFQRELCVSEHLISDIYVMLWCFRVV
jgi:hypothetical protein